MAKNICGIIIGETSSAEEAKKLADSMKNCPRLIFSGTASNMIYSVYVVPKEKRWWLKYPETNPKETGVEKARVYIVENVSYPEKFLLPKKKMETAPCGANCLTCHLREKYHCNGCPATIFYKNAK